ARRVDRGDADLRPASKELDRLRPRARSHVEDPGRSGLDRAGDLVDRRECSRGDDGRPPARIALGDPVVPLSLVGHRPQSCHAAGSRNTALRRVVSAGQPGLECSPSGSLPSGHARPVAIPMSSLRRQAPRTGARMTRPVALRILVLAAGVGLIAQAVLLDNLLGVNAPILAALLLVAAFVLRPVDSRIDPLDRWLPPAALAISASIAVRADPTLLALDLGAACVLLGASIAAIAVTRRSAVGVVELAFLVLGWAGVGILSVTAAARRPDPSRDIDPGPT